MAKQIRFEFEGTDYTLEFTRNSIRQMESKGFKINDIQDKPMTVLPQLFAGAFLVHHRNIKQETVDKIFNQMGNKQELIEKLGAMYAEPLESLFDEPEEGNLKWEASW